MSQPVIAYGDARSGNCRKVYWALRKAGIAFEWRELDIMVGATRTAQFLRLNPNGRVPLVVLPDGETLAESNAILWYFGASTDWWPNDHLARARVIQWLCFEQYSHEPYIAVRRFIRQYLDWPNERLADYEAREAPGYAALDVMEQTLQATPFIAGESMSLADVALYAYTSVAEEGGFELERFASIRDWLERCSPVLPDPELS